MSLGSKIVEEVPRTWDGPSVGERGLEEGLEKSRGVVVGRCRLPVSSNFGLHITGHGVKDPES